MTSHAVCCLWSLLVTLAENSWSRGLQVFNNCHSGPRTPMSIAMSEDDGVTWTWLRNLDEESEGANSKVELSYPTVMETSDEMIHVSYRTVTFKQPRVSCFLLFAFSAPNAAQLLPFCLSFC